MEEAQSLDLGVRAETLPYIPLRLAAWRGDVSTALDLVEVMIARRPQPGRGMRGHGRRTRHGDPLQRAW